MGWKNPGKLAVVGLLAKPPCSGVPHELRLNPGVMAEPIMEVCEYSFPHKPGFPVNRATKPGKSRDKAPATRLMF